MQEKYKDRGIVFLGFTTHESEQASAFLRRHGISWPNAYGIDALRMSSPIIYVVGTDGRIIWTDDRARYRHEVAKLRAGLEAALERELKAAEAAE